MNARYQLCFLLNRLGLTAETVGSWLATVGGLGILVAMTFAIGSGIASDRPKRRQIFILMAGVLMRMGARIRAFATGLGLFVATVLVIVVAAAMVRTVDGASDLIPELDRASTWMTTHVVASGGRPLWRRSPAWCSSRLAGEGRTAPRSSSRVRSSPSSPES